MANAPIDIKNTFIRVTDGRQAVLSPASTPANSRLTFTDASKHRGTRPAVKIALIAAGLNTALSVTVGGPNLTDVTVNLATDGAGVQTSTANQIIAAIALVPAALALLTTTTFGGNTGVGITDPAVQASLATGPRAIVFKVGEGNLTYSEKVARQYVNDRGLLDLVRNGDQDPFDVKTEFVWDYLQAYVGSGTPTVEDALDQKGEAAAWVSTATDPCEPYCIDLELEHVPPCSGVAKEYLMFQTFRYESLDHDPKAGKISLSGKCNALQPLDFRIS